MDGKSIALKSAARVFHYFDFELFDMKWFILEKLANSDFFIMIII